MPSRVPLAQCWLSPQRVLIFCVRNFFKPNIDSHGRLVRGGIAVLFFIAGGVAIFYCWWLGLDLSASEASLCLKRCAAGALPARAA